MRGSLPPWVRAAAVISGGSLAAQLVMAAGSVLIVALYTPSQLGAAAGFVSLLSALSVVAALRCDLAIPLASDERSAAEVLAGCLGLVAITSAVAGAVAIAFGPALVRWAGGPARLADLRFLVFPALLVSGAVTVLLQWATRERTYGLVGRTRFAQALTQVAAQAGFGAAGAGAPGLAAAAMLGAAGGSVRLARAPLACLARIRPARGAFRPVLSRYRELAAFTTATALCNGLGTAVVPLLLAGFYGPRAAGLFAIAYRLLAVPVRIAGEGVSRTFFGDTAAMSRTDPALVPARLRQTAAVLLVAGLVPALALAVFGPALLGALGHSWGPAGRYVRPLALMMLAQFVVTPLHQVLVVLGRVRLQTALAVLRLAAVLVPLAVARAAGGSALAAVAALAAGGVAGYAVSLAVCYRTAVSHGLAAGRVATDVAEHPVPA